MKNNTWMPLYVGDYLADTLHLTTEQHGAYFLLMFHAWKCGGYIPDDPAQLASITKLGESKWLANASVLLSFWFHDALAKRYSQGRLLREIQRSKDITATRSAVGKLGGRPKKQTESKTKPNDKANGKQNETPSQPQPQLVERESGEFPEVPPMTRKDYDAMATMRGVPKDCAEWFWNACDGRNWLDTKGQPIRKVEPLLMNAFAKWRANEQRNPGQPVKKPQGVEACF